MGGSMGKIRIFALMCMTILLVASCNKNATVSVETRLEQVDTLIKNGEVQEALDILNDISVKAVTPWICIGIAGRYKTLGESALAIKLLEKTLDKNPNMLELNAVCVDLLLQEGKAQEAKKYSAVLSGTKYGSLYAETELRLLDLSQEQAVKENIAIFLDAYKADKQSFWVENAASIYMEMAQFNAAFDLKPDTISNKKEAFFWALIAYDSLHYDSALDYIASYDIFVDKDALDAIDIDAVSLKDDIFLHSGKEDEANEMRQEVLKSLWENSTATIDNSSKLAIILLNSAIYAKSHDMHSERYHLLAKLIDYYPQYIPGIIAYGNYALDSMQWIETDKMILELRKNGKRTTSMEIFDTIPKIPIEDVTQKLDLLSKDSDKADVLQVLKVSIMDEYSLILAQQTNGAVTRENNLPLVYDLLEKYADGKKKSGAVMRYAISVLLRRDLIDEAKHIFNSYMKSKYTADFLPEDSPQNLELWECEYQAFFDIKDKKISAAKRLYEYMTSETLSGFSPQVALNLAMLYSSKGDRQKAIDLYTKAAGFTQDSLLKSEALYRAANLNYDMGKKKDAIYLLEYALQENPAHNKARTLLRQCRS